jgi:hypothetical protein
MYYQRHIKSSLAFKRFQSNLSQQSNYNEKLESFESFTPPNTPLIVQVLGSVSSLVKRFIRNTCKPRPTENVNIWKMEGFTRWNQVSLITAVRNAFARKLFLIFVFIVNSYLWPPTDINFLLQHYLEVTSIWPRMYLKQKNISN